MENVLNKVNGVLGLNGQHAQWHVEEAIKIDHVSVLCKIIAVGLIRKHKLVMLKLVQLQLHWDGQIGQIGQAVLLLAEGVRVNEVEHVKTVLRKDHVQAPHKKPKSVMRQHAHQ